MRPPKPPQRVLPSENDVLAMSISRLLVVPELGLEPGRPLRQKISRPDNLGNELKNSERFL